MNSSCKTQYVSYQCATFSSFYLQLSIDHVNYIPKKCGKKNILLNSWGLFAVSLLRLTDLSENNIVPKFVYHFDFMLVPLFWKENRQTHSIRLSSLKNGHSQMSMKILIRGKGVALSIYTFIAHFLFWIQFTT